MTSGVRNRWASVGVGFVAGVVALAACSSGATAPSSSRSAGPSGSATTRPLSAADQATIDKLAKLALVNGITGIVVGIDDPAKGRSVTAYGVADRDGAPTTIDMHYRIASVSKTFTAYAVLKLADEGQLDLSDKVSTYVSGVPNGSTMTVKDLVGMRSGLFDFTSDPTFGADYSANPTLPSWTPADALAITAAHPATTPGVKTQYDNTNYVLLGDVIAKASGMSADAYVTSVIPDFGLTNTSFPSTDDLPQPFIRGYAWTNAPAGETTPTAAPETRDVTVSNPLVPWTAGAMISTVPDMLAYAPQLATGRGLAPSTAVARNQFTPLTTSGVRVQYGLGITQLGDWVGHDGSIVGYSDMVFYLPSSKASLVVMVNEGNGDRVGAQALWGAIVKSLYPQTLTTW